MVESDFRIRRKKGSGTASRFWIKLQLRVTVLYCSCPPSKWRENEMKPAGIHNTIKRFAFTPLHTRIIVIQDALSYFVYWVWTSQESCSGLLKLFLMLGEKITFLRADMMDAGAFAYWYATTYPQAKHGSHHLNQIYSSSAVKRKHQRVLVIG